MTVLVAHLQSGIPEYSTSDKSRLSMLLDNAFKKLIQSLSRRLPRQDRIKERKEFRLGLFKRRLRHFLLIPKMEIEAALRHPCGGLQIADTR